MTDSNTKQTYFWYCTKCGDDYYTEDKQEAQKHKNIRWRCLACVMSL